MGEFHFGNLDFPDQPDITYGSSSVLVKRLGIDILGHETFEVSTQPYPDDMAMRLVPQKGNQAPIPIGPYHLPFRMIIKNLK